MVPSKNHLVIGRIVSAYGLKGWVKVRSFTEPQANLLEYRKCLVSDRPAEIEQGKIHGSSLVVKFCGCDDREGAERLCRQEISVDSALFPDLPDGSFYRHQLEGLQVWNCYGGSEVLIGTVGYLIETGSNDVVVVKPCEGSIDQKERVLPYRPEVVLNVDLGLSRMLVDWDPDF